MNLRIGVLVTAVTAVFFVSVSAADDPVVRELTAAESAVVESITQSSVLGTVGFLASDEMAGRDTPSPELTIASAYVAARFRAAGLEGLGPDGSFFQTHEYSQSIPPANPGSLSVQGRDVRLLDALFGAVDATEIRGRLVTADAEVSEGTIAVVTEPALPPQAMDRPASALAAVARAVLPVQSAGASAVLVLTAADSPLLSLNQSLRLRPATIPQQLRPRVPVILVAAAEKLSGEAVLNAAAEEPLVSDVRNVIGVVRGSDPELTQEAIIISAHLDHIGRVSGDRGGDTINNGADDNATGVTAVITLADAFGRLEQKPRRSVIFMTFWGEEKGLLGSRAYCETPLWPLQKTVANINIEMIGRPEEGADSKAWGTGWTRSSLGSQLAAGAERVGVEIFHREDVSEMLYTRSDNYAFVGKGVIAHSYSAGSLHSDYHRPTDEVERLNIPHMTHVIQGLFAGSLPLAWGELTPVVTESK